MASEIKALSGVNSWYKLDNAAKIYPAISGIGSGSIFRLAVQLKYEVDAQILQKALEITLPRFPTLAVKMRKGLFWYYFEKNTDMAVVSMEKSPPCRAIEAAETGGFLFRVSYYKKRISLEIFHALTDGAGAMAFLKSLTFEYLILSGFGQVSDGSILDCETPPFIGEAEDSFRRYYDPRVRSRWVEDKAYHIRGTKMAPGQLGVIHGTIPLNAFLDLVHKHNTTVTEYITALIMYSIYCTQLNRRVCRTPVKISVPVNLRNFFPSKTLRNFSSYINVGITFSDQEYSFEKILNIVSEIIKSAACPEKFVKKISANVNAERNIFMRMAPLALKNIVLRTAYNAYGENLFTCSLSNLGSVNLPETMKEHVERFEFVLGPPVINFINCGVCSFKEDLFVTFTKTMHETDIEMFFFRYLTEKGLEIVIETNRG